LRRREAIWWRGRISGVQEREQIKTNWTNRARAKLTCPSGASSCHGLATAQQIHALRALRQRKREEDGPPEGERGREEVEKKRASDAFLEAAMKKYQKPAPERFSMCKVCRQDPEVYARDPCLAKFWWLQTGKKMCHVKILASGHRPQAQPQRAPNIAITRLSGCSTHPPGGGRSGVDPTRMAARSRHDTAIPQRHR